MRKISNRSLIKYHRWMGIFTAFFIIILALTGVLLQHTDTFGFSKTHLRQAWLLSWYNSPTAEIHSIEINNHHVVQVDQNLLLDQNVIGKSNGKLWGSAIQNNDTILIGSGTSLFWLTLSGELIDILNVPVKNPMGLSSTNTQFTLKSLNGWLAADEGVEHWFDIPTVDSALPEIVEPSIDELILPDTLPIGISVERLLQDLHSGRFFGIIGVIIMDLASLALVLLAISGCWVWIKKR